MTDNRTTELLPCPFCGRRATIHSWWSSDEECGKANVGCSRESYSNGYECARIFIMRCDEKTARRDAMRIWNKRTPDQAVAATPGAGECELVETDSYSNTNEVIHVLECSACGKSCEHVNGSYPKCPNCGRKVTQ